MRITESKLRRIIRKTITESGYFRGEVSWEEEARDYIETESHQGRARETCTEEILVGMFGPDIIDWIESTDDIYRTGSPDLGYWYEWEE